MIYGNPLFFSAASSRLFAAIGVTYPPGSVLTCTNGEQTFKAKNTSGQWVFAIPEPGDWTVTATKGSNSKSQSVSITAQEQYAHIRLSFSYLYNAGVFDEEYEITEFKNTKCTIAYNEENIYIKSTADSTAYGFVVFKDVIFEGQSAITVNRTSTSAGNAKNGVTIAVLPDYTIWDPKNKSSGTVAYFYDGSADAGVYGPVDRSLDISAVTPGVYDVAVGFSTQGDRWVGARNIYLHYIKME